jgi:hypothetical protein
MKIDRMARLKQTRTPGSEVLTTVDLIVYIANRGCQGRIKRYELITSFRATPAATEDPGYG